MTLSLQAAMIRFSLCIRREIVAENRAGNCLFIFSVASTNSYNLV
ncbi:hypothetical protein A28LD_0832 [Idiomarina sp. A28L]|nr:hypothetical protein A28LD_0832 [Idiomarina sp. A28L]